LPSLHPTAAETMLEGTPGTPFEGEVVVRRRRWASDESGFAVVDAERDGDEIVLIGTIAHLEERERVRVSGVWQDDRRFGLQVKVATAEPLAPRRRRGADLLPQARQARRRRSRRAAGGPLRRRRARRDRPRSARRLPRRRMAESTGMDATTIHSALGWVSGHGPTVDALRGDLLIVDETSMANLELLVTLRRSTRSSRS